MTQQGKSLVVRAIRKGCECARTMDAFLQRNGENRRGLS